MTDTPTPPPVAPNSTITFPDGVAANSIAGDQNSRYQSTATFVTAFSLRFEDKPGFYNATAITTDGRAIAFLPVEVATDATPAQVADLTIGLPSEVVPRDKGPRGAIVQDNKAYAARNPKLRSKEPAEGPLANPDFMRPSMYRDIVPRASENYVAVTLRAGLLHNLQKSISSSEVVTLLINTADDGRRPIMVLGKEGHGVLMPHSHIFDNSVDVWNKRCDVIGVNAAYEPASDFLQLDVREGFSPDGRKAIAFALGRKDGSLATREECAKWMKDVLREQMGRVYVNHLHATLGTEEPVTPKAQRRAAAASRATKK